MRWLLVLVIAACGSRTGFGNPDFGSNGTGSGGSSGGSNGGGGSSGGSDVDGSLIVDASSVRDAALTNDAGCTAAMVMEVFGGTKQQCKMQITWSCNGTHYQIGLGCGEANPASFGGACTKDGMPTGTMWNDPSSSEGCSCSDPAKTAALAAMKCGFPGPFVPN